MGFPPIRDVVSLSGDDFVSSNPGNFTTLPYYLPGKESNTSGGVEAYHLGDYSSSKAIVTQRKIETLSFAGSFSYYIPMGKGLAANLENYSVLYDRLVGLTPTVEALWQLAPWSWLADWLYDLSATISSYERVSADNLVLNYGYVSRNSVKSSVATCVFEWSQSQRGEIPTVKAITSTVRSVKKERIRANPFGFTARTPDSLNGKQWAVLTAIGIGRV